jgi:phage-related holin
MRSTVSVLLLLLIPIPTHPLPLSDILYTLNYYQIACATAFGLFASVKFWHDNTVAEKKCTKELEFLTIIKERLQNLSEYATDICESTIQECRVAYAQQNYYGPSNIYSKDPEDTIALSQSLQDHKIVDALKGESDLILTHCELSLLLDVVTKDITIPIASRSRVLLALLRGLYKSDYKTFHCPYTLTPFGLPLWKLTEYFNAHTNIPECTTFQEQITYITQTLIEQTAHKIRSKIARIAVYKKLSLLCGPCALLTALSAHVFATRVAARLINEGIRYIPNTTILFSIPHSFIDKIEIFSRVKAH